MENFDTILQCLPIYVSLLLERMASRVSECLMKKKIIAPFKLMSMCCTLIFNVVWLHVAFYVYDLVILVYVAIVWFHVSMCLFTLSETKNKIYTLSSQWYQIYDAHRIFTQYQGWVVIILELLLSRLSVTITRKAQWRAVTIIQCCQSLSLQRFRNMPFVK